MNATRSLIKSKVVSVAPARLQLTSLVDMMVILVVFLLKSFSVEGQLVTPAAGLELPTSTSQTHLEAGLMIEVGSERVRIDGREILPTADLTNGDDLVEAKLLAALGGAQTRPKGTPVLVQADRGLDYDHLSRILRACSAAGWTDVTLVVLEVKS